MIHETAIIENCTIADGVIVWPYAVIQNTTIEQGCEIRPHASIHDSHIEKGCVVGGEVSCSHFWENTKKKHEGYASHVQCWKNCMLWWGSMFARYDGKGKWTFEIGDNVFIWANVVISTKADKVRKIWNNVKIWALCHVKKDIPDDSLVYIDDTTGTETIREGYYS